MRNKDRSSIEKRHRLNTRNFKTLAAAQVLAHNQIVATDHVGAGLGKFGAIALIGAWRKLSFLGAYQPGKFVLIGLLTMGAVQGVRLPGFFLVKKIALIHNTLFNHEGHEGSQRTSAATYGQNFKSCYNCGESRNHQSYSFVSFVVKCVKEKENPEI